MNSYDYAEQLVAKMFKAPQRRDFFAFWKRVKTAKRCALICVDECIEQLNEAGIVAGDQLEFLASAKEEIPKVGI